MRVLHVTEPCGTGGAGIACERLHQALLLGGVDSQVVCETDARRAEHVYRLNQTYPMVVRTGRAAWERIGRVCGFDPEALAYHVPGGVASYVNQHPSDVAHLHWFTQRFLPLSEICRIKKPCVWTLHDLWPESFPFRYPQWALEPDAVKDARNFAMPPTTVTTEMRRLSQWAIKQRVRLVCLSRWHEQVVRRGPLFAGCEIEVIPNPLDVNRFRPLAQDVCRQILGIDGEDAFVLVTAANPYSAQAGERKGGDLLAQALEYCLPSLAAEGRRVVLLILGHTAPPMNVRSRFGVAPYFLGHLGDDYSLAMAYSAADACVVPARTETFGLVASEAQACGCPVVGFNGSGTSDVVIDGSTGVLVDPFDSSELGVAIGTLIRNNQLCRTLGTGAQVHVRETMSQSLVAGLMMSVYTGAG